MGNRRIRTLAGAAVLAAVAAASPAQAQTESSSNLASLLPELILREIRLPTSPQGISHSAHFSPFTVDDISNPAVAIVESFNKLMVVQLSTSPIGSSAGGFSYAFDAALGTFRRASSSFGPLFAERATTLGRGRFSAGFNYQHSRYDAFEGSALDDGSIKFYLRHQDCCRTGTGPPVPPLFGVELTPDGTLLNPFFEGDVIEAALSLNVTTDSLAVFGNYGVTNRWDVGIAVPFVRVDMEAKVLATIQRLATSSNTNIHSFVAGDPTATQSSVSRSDSATGLGDIALRSKFRVLDFPAGGLAATVEFRLPTGNEDDLLGGSAQVKFLLVESSGNERFTHHFNLGYAFSGSLETTGTTTPLTGAGDFPDELAYAAGVEFVVQPRVTVIGDIVGRMLRGVGRLSLESKTFQFQPGGGPPPPPVASVQFEEFEPRPGNLNLLYGTAGVKVNPTGNLLFSASVLFPLTDAGLKSKLTTIIGMDYAF